MIVSISDTEYMMRSWGGWARDGGLRKLWYSTSSSEQKIPGKTYPPENPEAEMVDRCISSLDTHQRDLLTLYYIGDGLCGCMTDNGIAMKRGISRRKVKADRDTATGIVCGMLRLWSGVSVAIG